MGKTISKVIAAIVLGSVVGVILQAITNVSILLQSKLIHIYPSVATKYPKIFLLLTQNYLFSYLFLYCWTLLLIYYFHRRSLRLSDTQHNPGDKTCINQSDLQLIVIGSSSALCMFALLKFIQGVRCHYALPAIGSFFGVLKDPPILLENVPLSLYHIINIQLLFLSVLLPVKIRRITPSRYYLILLFCVILMITLGTGSVSMAFHDIRHIWIQGGATIIMACIYIVFYRYFCYGCERK